MLGGYFKDKKDSWGGIDVELDEYLTQIEKYVLRGGKFNRSALVRLSSQVMGGEDNRGLMEVAAAVLPGPPKPISSHISPPRHTNARSA